MEDGWMSRMRRSSTRLSRPALFVSASLPAMCIPHMLAFLSLSGPRALTFSEFHFLFWRVAVYYQFSTEVFEV